MSSRNLERIEKIFRVKKEWQFADESRKFLPGEHVTVTMADLYATWAKQRRYGKDCDFIPVDKGSSCIPLSYIEEMKR